jgi:hypothetical protein
MDYRDLVKPKGFIRAFENELPNHPTYTKAYEAVETVYQQHFKHRRYSSYNSFQTSRKRIKSQIEVW